MIKNLIQTSLDTVLYPKGIYTHEQLKTGADADEYIVYSMGGDIKESFTDDKVNIKNANVTVKYFYREDKLGSYASRQAVREVEELIESTLEASGFNIPFGGFDAGDVDGIGYRTTIFECEYWRVPDE